MAGQSDPPGTRLARRLDALIVGRPWLVILAFFVVTGLLFAGIGNGSAEREAGPDQFVEELDEYRALQDMHERFDRPGRDDVVSLTVYVRDDRNVLSRASLLRLIAFERIMAERFGEQVHTESVASALAEGMSGGRADTLDRQQLVLERATESQLERAIRAAADRDDAPVPLSADFDPATGSASVTQLAVSFDVAPGADESDGAALVADTVRVVDGIEGLDAGENALVMSEHVVDQEVNQLLTDTVSLVFPAVVLLIGLFLLVAYRDPFDVALGAVALVMVLIWTFGFIGYAGIPFSDALVPVFPLLLAVGIDFGVHIINRYREERADGRPISASMTATTGQLGSAFLIATVTTIFGLVANLFSPLRPLRHFGLVAAAGMVCTLLVFGVFLAAGKVALDRLRRGTIVPAFGTTPIASEGSTLGRLLAAGSRLATVSPAVVLLVAVLVGAGAGAYGTDVGTEFSQEAFFPDEDRIELYQALPEPVRPSRYTFTAVIDVLETHFDQGWIGSVTVYVEDSDVRSDVALAAVDRALTDPPDALAAEERRAVAGSVLDPIDRLAERDASFAALVDASDSTGDGVPDRNVDAIYAALFDSNVSDQTGRYLSADRGATRIVYDLPPETDPAEATDAAATVAADMPLDATATGDVVVEQVVVQRITRSAFGSLAVAFVLTALFLALSFRWLEGRAIYGLVTLVPVLVVVALLLGTMRYFGIPFSPYNAPILSVSIGLGVDYSVHFMHRFVDEFERGRGLESALLVTIRGTGGALTGSMLTTAFGLGALSLAVIPLIVEFGLLLALGVVYAYVAAVFLLPSVLVAWIGAERRFRGTVSGAKLARFGP